MNKIVAAYARVSKIDQHPENQINELKRYVESRGWTMYNGEPFVDHGISGSKGQDKRPGLKALMDAAFRKKIKAVIVWEFSRFARSTRQLLEALENFRVWGIDFISVQQHLDTSTANGRLMFGVIALFAEWEREMIRERTLLGLAEALANGKKLGRRQNEFDVDLMKKNIHLSVRKLASVLNVSPTTSARIKRRYGVPEPGSENGVVLLGEKS